MAEGNTNQENPSDFLNGGEECGICSDKDADLGILLMCGHRACFPCLIVEAEDFLRLSSNNDKPSIKCPVSPSSCKVPLNFTQYQEVLPPYVYKKFVKRRVALDLKDTAPEAINTCPKCKSFAEVEGNCFLGTCTHCEFVFCSNCKSNYHGFECGNTPTKEYVDTNDYEILEMFQDASLEDATNPPAKLAISCCICLTDVPISDIVDFGCDHLNTCQPCAKDYFENKIASGEIQGLTCPDQSCNFQASQSFIGGLVDPLVFARLEKLQLDDALKDDPELVKCPKANCQEWLRAEPEYGYCERCDYRFCTGCNQDFHGAVPCGLSQEEVQNFMSRYAAADDAERERLENELKGKRKQENEASEQLIQRIYQKCPQCKTDIEKIMGCNKMECTKCGTFFCWICACRITTTDKYAHFQNSGCTLFEVPPD